MHQLIQFASLEKGEDELSANKMNSEKKILIMCRKRKI